MAARELYATIGESKDYSLLAETGTERTVGLAVKPGSGLLERGTIVMMGADGLYAPTHRRSRRNSRARWRCWRRT